MVMQDVVQLGWSPAGARLRSLISFIWKAQLLLHVFPNPLRQLCRQPAQGCLNGINLLHSGVTMASSESCRVSALGYTLLVLVYCCIYFNIHHIHAYIVAEYVYLSIY